MIRATQTGPASPARRRVVLAGLFIAAAGAQALVRPRAGPGGPAAGTLDRIMPRNVAPFRAAGGTDQIMPADSELTGFTYADILTRTYLDTADAALFLLAACSAGGEPGLSVHRPEDCYPAYGFDLDPTGMVTVPLANAAHAGIPACFFTARRADRIEHVLYWVRVGGAFPASQAAQRIAVAQENLRGRLPDSVLVRLSVIDGPARDARDRLTRFAAALLAQLDRSGRAVVLGTAHG
jgi:EpsI family protein